MQCYTSHLGRTSLEGGKWCKCYDWSGPLARNPTKSLPPKPISTTFTSKRPFHLNQIADPTLTNIWHQGWLSSQDLEILEIQIREWNRYTTSMHTSHIHLTNSADKLVWEHAKHGQYTPKIGYQQLCSQLFQQVQKL